MEWRKPWGRWLVHILAAGGLIFGLAGCKKPPPESVGPVARLEISPRGLLLTSAGAQRQLSASAFDAEGRAVPAPTLSWRSSSPANIAVDEQGAVVAQVANGASQIFVESEGVTSPPLLVAVTTLPPGALTLTDSQIAGEPKATDPSAAPVVGATYDVVLAGVDPPAPGTLVVGTEAQPVGGKVVATQREGDHVRVTLAVVPVRELLPNLTISERIDLSNVEPEIPADLKDTYDITREGDTLRFSPRTSTGSSSGGLRQPAKISAKLPPFDECEVDATGVSQFPLTLSQAPALGIQQRFSLDFVYTSGVGLERLAARGDFGATYDGSLTVALAFQGTASCTKELAVIRIPVAGVLSWVVSGVIPISVGVELNGKVTLASLVVGAKAEAKAQAEFGVACPGGTNCAFVRGVTGSASADPVWKKPTANDLRVDASFWAFAKAEVGIGNPVFPRVRFSAVSVRSGPTIEGSFAPWTEQVLDTGYSSSYGLSLVSKGSVGVDLPKVLARFGITDITILELQLATQLAQSPKGTWTADRGSFAAGDKVNFQIELDPATLEFPPTVGPYNVKELILVRKVGASSFLEAGRATVPSGHRSVTLPFTATDSGQTSDFSAFVLTTLLPFDNLALELERRSSCELTNLGTLGGDSEGTGINDSGQVVGASVSGRYLRAFLWDRGVMTALGTLGAQGSWAEGIDANQRVVGGSADGSGNNHAFLWAAGSMQDLGTLGGPVSFAYQVNATSEVAGYAHDAAGISHAVMWRGGAIVDLGDLDPLWPNHSAAYGINDAHQVVGNSATDVPGETHAFLWQGGAMQDLGTLGGRLSTAWAINEAGQVVGESWLADNVTLRAFLWNGSMQDLGALGWDRSFARDVNDLGHVVGGLKKGQTEHAFVWADGRMTDLNDLVPPGAGWELQDARAINNRGDIVGRGKLNGQTRGFLMRSWKSCSP